MSPDIDEGMTLRTLLGTRVRAECFILCDAAQVHDGKLFVLGAGWDRLVVPLFPSEHRFYLAIKLAVPAGDAYRPFEMRVDVRDEEGVSTGGVMPTTRVEVARPLGYLAHEDLPCMFAFEARVTFGRPERLTFALLIDNEEVARTSLRVAGHNTSPAPPAPPA
jgi:hypothetical protein